LHNPTPQAPWTQLAVACTGGGQTCPHLPQFFGSVCVSIGPEDGWQGPSTPWAEQACWHPDAATPQGTGFEPGLQLDPSGTQAPESQWLLAGQTTPAHASGTHSPPTQRLPGSHVTDRQAAGTHCPPTQRSLPVQLTPAQAASTQKLETQTWLAWHAPAAQLVGRHAPWAHSVPEGQVIPTHELEMHAPATQADPGAHCLPQH
jgi:hypothetical protein